MGNVQGYVASYRDKQLTLAQRGGGNVLTINDDDDENDKTSFQLAILLCCLLLKKVDKSLRSFEKMHTKFHNEQA